MWVITKDLLMCNSLEDGYIAVQELPRASGFPITKIADMLHRGF